MQNHIKVAVIGGTGKSGKYLVQQLINEGISIKMLVRNPNHLSINHPLIEIVYGNVQDYHTVYQLLEGCRAVISTLGLGIPASEPTLFSQATRHILQGMEAWHIRRYIVTTGLNVDTPFDKKSPKTMFGTEWMKKNYPVSTQNKQDEYQILVDSHVDWTLVRLPLIEQTAERYLVKISTEDCLGDKISATDLAYFLVEQLSTTTFIQKAPFVANS